MAGAVMDCEHHAGCRGAGEIGAKNCQVLLLLKADEPGPHNALSTIYAAKADSAPWLLCGTQSLQHPAKS